MAVLLLAAVSTPLSAARNLRPLEIKQRYRQALTVLAGGDLDSALDQLQALELQAVGDEQAWRFVDDLWRLKLQVIRDLLESGSPDLLMPIVVLHHDVYFRYTELQRSYLAQHSRTMSVELAEVYAERAGTEVAGAFAGWTLSSFASYLWSPSNVGVSADLFFRAFLVDPGNRLALKGLALAYERAGDYGKALEYLHRALAIDARDPELRLRQVLCQMRQEREVPARHLETLRQLTGEANPGWIRSVAFQELARALWAADDLEASESVLRDALAILAGDQQLSLQLAAILDSRRRRRESLAVLDDIRVDGWEHDSPRLQYDFWMPPDLEPMRLELHEQAEKGLRALSASLSAPAASGTEP